MNGYKINLTAGERREKQGEALEELLLWRFCLGN